VSGARFLLVALLLASAGCASTPSSLPAPTSDRSGSAVPPDRPGSAPAPRRGAFYKDDGPGDNPPADLASIPDAEPRLEPLHRFANRPYQVLGRDYVPMTALTDHRERGTGSWYGRRFHGQPTSSGERYDMYGMTAAHPTLPIPSYARVTNLTNGRSVVVRINDRGPFLAGRVIDLSYTAAWKLGYTDAGSASVEVQALPAPGAVLATAPRLPALAAAPAASSTVASGTSATASGVANSVYLQLGSFSARENAEGLRQRLLRELAWIREALQIQAAGNLFRLQVGPYRNRDEASVVAERIRNELNFAPLLVVR